MKKIIQKVFLFLLVFVAMFTLTHFLLEMLANSARYSGIFDSIDSYLKCRQMAKEEFHFKESSLAPFNIVFIIIISILATRMFWRRKIKTGLCFLLIAAALLSIVLVYIDIFCFDHHYA